MATYRANELTDKEKRQIDEAHDRIVETLWRQYADAFAGDQAFFLHECSICFEQEIDACNALISTLKLEKMQPDISVVWQALNSMRDKFDPFQAGYKPISDDEKLFQYLRSVVWRMRNKNRKDEYAINAHQVFDGCYAIAKNKDIHDMELDISLHQVARNMKPERKAETIAALRKWMFEDVTRNALAAALNWDQRRVSRVWKSIQEHRVREKMLE